MGKGMNVLVFTTCDITPEQWADFTNATALEPTERHPNGIRPYVLVHSNSQPDFTALTEEIDTTLKTDFPAFTWLEILPPFKAIARPRGKNIQTIFFMILDEESWKDRRVVLVQKWLEWRTQEGDVWGAGRESRDDLTEWAVWKKHRVPFDEALNMWIDLSVHGGLDEEPYLEEEFKEPDEGGWRWQAG